MKRHETQQQNSLSGSKGHKDQACYIHSATGPKIRKAGIMTTTFLKETWTVSRGRDTYGWNICTILDTNTDKKYRCNGGGYDMTGTSFASWLEATHQEQLTKWAQTLEKRDDIGESTYTQSKEFYGMYINPDHVGLDGACGVSSMIKIAEAIGLHVKQLYTRKGSEGFIVEE